LLKLMTFLYGKPCKNDGSFKAKYLRFFYWLSVVFFTTVIVIAAVYCFFEPTLIPTTILGALVIPFFVRFVYSANLRLQGLKREH
jgi:hypothetical protein